MAYLLDTNIISALRRPEKLSPTVRQTLEAIPTRLSSVSVISIMEIEVGILQKERTDKLQGSVLRHWFDSWRASLSPAAVLTIDDRIALCCAKLHVPDPRPTNDALIAATAIHHDLTLVTRNASDFAGIPECRVLNPWSVSA